MALIRMFLAANVLTCANALVCQSGGSSVGCVVDVDTFSPVTCPLSSLDTCYTSWATSGSCTTTVGGCTTASACSASATSTYTCCTTDNCNAGGTGSEFFVHDVQKRNSASEIVTSGAAVVAAVVVACVDSDSRR